MDDKTLKKLLAGGLLAGAAYYFWKTQQQVSKFAPVTVENGNMTLTGTSDVPGLPAGLSKEQQEMAMVPNPMPEPDASALPLPIDATKAPYAEAIVESPALPLPAPADVAVEPYDEPEEFTTLPSQ